MKSPQTKMRVIQVIIDYIVICIYLLFLLTITSIFFYFVLNGIPDFTEFETQIISTLTSVVPIILLFTYFDYYSNTPGRKFTKLKLHFKNKSYVVALLRNIVKFMPWQIGHIGTIHGVYTDFNTTAIIISIIGTSLLLIMLYLGLFTKDKRYFADMVVDTYVYAS